ncbi:MAG: methylmalonyl-CoA mutase, N-terminal domain, partial [Gaiellales bacterium]|nr:methylmalonyl-CoA mutase, N-terminal domain [Gaiellales bacterium]
GVNRFQDDTAPMPERFDVPAELEPAQRARLEQLRAQRDSDAVAAALDDLAAAARGGADLMPPILAAVRADASLGEICGALRSAFGEYRPAAAASI